MKKRFKEFRSYLKKQPRAGFTIFIMLMIAIGFVIVGIIDKLKWSTIVLLVVITVVLTILGLLFLYLMERQDRRLIEQHNQQVRSQNKTGSH